MDKPLDKYTEYEMQILVHHLICYVLVMTIQVRHVEAICKDPFFHPFTGGMVPTPLGRPEIRTFPGPFQDLGQIYKDLQLTYDS